MFPILLLHIPSKNKLIKKNNLEEFERLLIHENKGQEEQRAGFQEGFNDHRVGKETLARARKIDFSKKKNSLLFLKKKGEI